MICAALVVGKLVTHRTTYIKTFCTSSIKDTNNAISKLDLNHFSIRKVIIHQTFSPPLKSLGQFRVHQGGNFSKITLNRFSSFKIGVPSSLNTTFMDGRLNVTNSINTSFRNLIFHFDS